MNAVNGVLLVLVVCTPRCAFAQANTSSTATTASSKEEAIIIIDEEEEEPEEEAIIIVDEGEPEAPEAEPVFDIRARASVRCDVQVAVDTSFDRKGEQVAELALSGWLELDVDIAPQVSIYAQPRFTHVSSLSREGDDREIFYLLPPEAYLRWSIGPVFFRVGTMVFSWGASDFVAPSDVLNPVDMRRNIIAIDGESKIPALAAEVAFTKGPFSIRGVVQPFFTASRFHLMGWDYAIYQPQIFPGLPNISLDEVFSPATVDRIGDELLVTERPEDRPDNATLGLRATVTLGDLELSASAVHGWEQLPRLVIDPDVLFLASVVAEATTKQEPVPLTDPEVLEAVDRLQLAIDQGRNVLKGTYERRNLIGFDATYALDPFLFKVDVAYTFERTIYTQDTRPVSLPWLNAVVGLEYFDGEDLQIIVEAFALTVIDIVSNYRLMFFEPRAPPPSTGPAGKRTISLPGMLSVVRYSMLGGDLRFELAAGVTFTRQDFVIAPNIAWRIDDNHQVNLGGIAVEGKEDGYGGAFTHTDQIFIGYRYSR